MISATLGPPPAAAGSVGSAEPHSEGIEPRDADHAGGGFSARLRDAAHSPRPAAKDGAHTNDTAAGPAEGELHQATAEAGDQDEKVTDAPGAPATAAAKDAAATTEAAAPAGTPVPAPVTATPVAATAVPVATTATGAATAATPAVATSPVAGIVAVTAATAAAVTGAAPAATANTATAAGTTAAAVGTTGDVHGLAAGALSGTPATANTATATAPAAATTAAPATTPADPSAATAVPADPAAAARTTTQVRDGGDAASGPRPAATLTITLAPITPDAGTAGAQAAVPGAAPGGAGTEAGKPALAMPAPGTDAKGATPAPPAATAQVDPSLVGGAPAPSHGTASTGTTGTGHAGAAGAAHAQELAKDLGMRMHVSLREGGKEVMLSMRPPELGHVVVRMVMHDGVLQAYVIADRPEAARMLEQALPHLGEALSERGYTLEGMDISYQQQAHERPATAMDGGRGTRGLTLDDETPAADVPVGAAAGSRATAGTGRLDLLA
ncbi:MAG: flagellar hook-length control protein FliK [Thermoleophilia bacterium]|nr:flagellar hook-length control protein FliK [Thermoleophilia bacterium]